MAKPKNTVEYFPHLCKAGKTMHVLENKFGNDGYAFWFKLLEILAITPGHYYDFLEADDWEYITAKTKVNGEKALTILGTLATIKAIDHELYQVKIIWSQNLVDNLSEVYDRRKSGLPQRPDPKTRVQPQPKPDKHQGKQPAGEHTTDEPGPGDDLFRK